MNCENCGNNKTTKTTTALLGLVVVAALAGTMISIPTMIASAYAQSDSACPDGFRKERNRCVTEPTTTFTCEPVNNAGTPTRDGAVCTAEGDSSTFKERDCNRVDGTSTVNAGTRTCTYAAEEEQTCPGESRLNRQGLCEIKPGSSK